MKYHYNLFKLLGRWYDSSLLPGFLKSVSKKGMKTGPKLFLIALAVAMALHTTIPALAVSAATLTVNTTDDNTTAGDTKCTLREAINNANANRDTTNGDCVAGSGGDAITFSVTGEIVLKGSLPIITDQDGLAIDGTGQDITIRGNTWSRVLWVDYWAALTVQNLTIADGKEVNPNSWGGGGIFNRGTLVVRDSIFTNNSANVGGGIHNIGSMTVTGSTFSNNSAMYDGGGIDTVGSYSTTISDNTFSNNSSVWHGGGLYLGLNTDGTATVTGNTFSNNHSKDGGGFFYSGSGGPLTVSGSTFIGNTADSQGGGLYNLGKTMIVTGSSFSDNRANHGGGLYNNSTLTVTDSIFTNNNASFHGGGIYHSSQSTLTVTGSTFTDNQSTEKGGGIFTFGYMPTTVTDSTFSKNSATDGGGIYNNLNSNLTVTRSNFFNNTASNNGGGIFNNLSYQEYVTKLAVIDSIFSANSAGSQGGGIYNDFRSPMSVTGSTFQANTSFKGGGGIYNSVGDLTVDSSAFFANSAAKGGGIYGLGDGLFEVNNSTFSANSAVEGGGISGWSNNLIEINNSTFSDNSATQGGGISGRLTLKNTIVASSPAGGNCSGIIADGGGNLSYPDSTCPGINLDPRLDLLQVNPPGSTATHALLPGSAAIDTARIENCPQTDQRGVTRPQGPACDIGAYERIPSSPLELTEDLTEKVQELVDSGLLNRGQGNALIAKLEAALQQLDRGKEDVAINQLQAFINQAEGMINSGVLLPEDGQALIDAANEIIALLSS